MTKPPRKRAAKTRARAKQGSTASRGSSALAASSRTPAAAPPSLARAPSGYAEWLAELKTKITHARRRAVVAVNAELVRIYWELGRDILEKQARLGWGAKVIDKLAHDLRIAFPEMRGFSRANLMYMRAFGEAWPDEAIVQQVVGQLSWGANLVLLARTKDDAERRYYAKEAIEHAWSRNQLLFHIESREYERRGRATTNFARRLPAARAALAADALKDPYRFDFLGVGAEADERAIENALTTHITRFLLELGAGFAFVGRQVHLEIGGEDFYIDLLFYHLRLHCYVVVELKAGEFRPEHAGKLNFYLSAVDSQVRDDRDHATIGLILCKTKNRIIVEYALRNARRPIGVAEYQLVHALPARLETSLPSIEQLERELEEPPPNQLEARDQSTRGTPKTAKPALNRKGRRP